MALDLDTYSEQIEELLTDAQSDRLDGKFHNAKNKIEKAHQIAQSAANSDYKVKILNDLARVERDLGNNENSLSHYRDLYLMQKVLGNSSGMAHAQKHIGDIYLDISLFDEAENCFIKTLDLYHFNPENPTGTVAIANTLRSYAILLGKREDHSKALEYWKIAMNIYKKFNIREGVKECETFIDELK